MFFRKKTNDPVSLSQENLSGKVAIIGETASGKSFAIKQKFNQWLNEGKSILLIYPEDTNNDFELRSLLEKKFGFSFEPEYQEFFGHPDFTILNINRINISAYLEKLKASREKYDSIILENFDCLIPLIEEQLDFQSFIKLLPFKILKNNLILVGQTLYKRKILKQPRTQIYLGGTNAGEIQRLEEILSLEHNSLIKLQELEPGFFYSIDEKIPSFVKSIELMLH